MIRLHKHLAASGIASRRKSEDLITQGRIKVNGEVVYELGTKIDPDKDLVEVDGKTIRKTPPKRVVYALYKPKNCMTTLSDPQGRATIVEFFPKTRERLFPVGRLDYNAEGLIFLTNDGDFANQITHPSRHVWKEYLVKIKGKITPGEIKKLASGPVIDKKKRQPVKIHFLHFVNDKSWLAVSLQEGLKNHIKKMFFQIGYNVLKIKRYRIGNIALDELMQGESKLLTDEQIEELVKLSNPK
ncbi:MAG: rRNA pseudouridine synthase [Deltaproteobacteria bacterium]|nr:rRNA pseudouridine synthase [Deltaproteobacteria bacterium]